MANDKTVRVRSAKVVGDFRLVRVLGEGSNGSVYEAVYVKTQLPCAVKHLRRPDDPERSEKEALYPARAARQSNHVLNIHSYFQDDDGDFYLVTELIPHGDLGVFLKKNPSLSIQSALEIGLGIARGLAAIHADNIVHLDLKPANVLMDYKDGQWLPKIADFGLARSSGSIDLNQHGTVGYASPEHFDERLATTPASDMFSFGMMLYELLTGVRAFPGATLAEYATWILKRVPPPPPSSRRPELRGRDDLDALVARLLEFDLDRREKSSAAVVAALTASLTPAESSRERVKAPEKTSSPHITTQQPPKRRAAVIAAVVLLTGLIAGAASWLFRSGERENENSGPAAGMTQFKAANYADAFPLLLDEARLGKVDAQRALGQMYAEGLSVPRNPNEAKKWLDLAVQRDDAEARCVLGDLWRQGSLGEPNPQQAMRLYTDAARQHACGHAGMGELALAETRAPGRFDEALRQFELAAAQGHGGAVTRLRTLHTEWAIGPLVQGAWRPVTGAERRDELARLKAASGMRAQLFADVRRLRRLDVDFYEGAALYELEVGLPSGDVGAIEYLRYQDVLTMINGQASQIYELNTRMPVRLDTVQRAASFLRFFTAAVQGPNGIFRVIDDVDDLRWTPAAPREKRQEVAQRIEQWRLEPSASGGWHAVGPVAYNQGLLRVSFELMTNGRVDLNGQIEIAGSLPILLERFDPSGVRVIAAFRSSTNSPL